MNFVLAALGLAAAICAFTGGWYWLKASRVPLLKRGDWSGVEELNRMTREADLLKSLATSARFNALGAKWTGVAAGIAAIAALLSAFDALGL